MKREQPTNQPRKNSDTQHSPDEISKSRVVIELYVPNYMGGLRTTFEEEQDKPILNMTVSQVVEYVLLSNRGGKFSESIKREITDIIIKSEEDTIYSVYGMQLVPVKDEAGQIIIDPREIPITRKEVLKEMCDSKGKHYKSEITIIEKKNFYQGVD